jgi:hypothetical protein
MPEATDDGATPFDPFEPFRGVRDACLDAMSKAMIDAVNTESYAKTTGAMLDYCLTASAPFHETLEKAMVQALLQLSLPSRQEVAALAERFTNVEMRLDDLDAKVETVLKAVAGLKQVAKSGPIPAKTAKRRRAAAKRK